MGPSTASANSPPRLAARASARNHERGGERGFGRDVIERAHGRRAGEPSGDAGARAVEGNGDARFHAAIDLGFVENDGLDVA
jgi:hypothetical protein